MEGTNFWVFCEEIPALGSLNWENTLLIGSTFHKQGSQTE